MTRYPSGYCPACKKAKANCDCRQKYMELAAKQFQVDTNLAIIGEYMGWLVTDTDVYHPTFNRLNFGYIPPEMDFNLLMEVVEKIEHGNYGFKMCRKVVEVYFDDTKVVILKCKEKSRIESLRKAVVSFIQWFNNQNNQ